MNPAGCRALSWIRRGVIVAMALLTVACADDPPTSVPTPPLHTTMLTSAEFEALPALSLTLVASACPESEEQATCDVPLSGGVASGVGHSLLTFDMAPAALQLISGDPPSKQAIGRTGEGPGEYRYITTAALSADGRIFVLDLGLRRVLHYSAAGQYQGMAPMAPPLGYILPGFIGPDLFIVASQLTASTVTGDSADVGLYTFQSDGAARLVTILPVREIGYRLDELRDPRPMFAPRPQWQITSSGTILHAEGVTLSATVFDTSGATLLAIGVDANPREVTDEEFNRERDARLSRMSPSRVGKAMRQQLLDAPRAERHAGVTALRQLENGQIWLREAPDESGDRVGWVGFEGTGTPIGRVVLSSEARILASRDSLLLVSGAGATDAGSGLVWMRLGILRP